MRTATCSFASVALCWLGCLPRGRADEPSVEPDIVETIGAAVSAEGQGDGVTESVTELVEAPTPAVAVSVAPAASAPTVEESQRSKVSGWARESLEFYPYDGGLERARRDDVLGVPRDRLLSRTQLMVRASYQRGRWFEASVSGALDVAVHVEGSGRDLGVSSWDSQGTGEVLGSSLRDAYLGFFAGKFDLRIGQQRVAWGVADVLSPNDVVNARDLRDPFLSDPELNHLPTPLLRTTAYLGPVTLELLASPVFVPDQASLYGRNWSAIQPDAPAEYRGLFALLARATDRSLQEQINAAVYQTRLPNRNGRGFSAGAKLGLHTSALDLNAYYHYGYDGTPYLWLNPALANVLASTDFVRAGLSDLAPVLRAVDQGLAPVFAEYVRRHHAGVDSVLPWGPLVLKLEAAYQSQRVFYRSDLTSVAHPTVLAVLSLDWQTGSIEKVLVVEATYIRILADERARLLFYERDSYGVAAVVRWPLFSVFHLDARAMVGVAPYFYVAQPALVAKLSSFAIKLGALVLNGERASLGGYYRHNLTAFLQIRYGF